MACLNWNLLDAQKGSSAIGAFYAGMPAPLPTRPANGGFYPVYNDSVWCGAYSYPPGYAGLDAGKSFKNWVGETSKTSTLDCFKGGFNVWLNNAMCSNAPGVVSMGCQFIGALLGGGQKG